MRTLAHRCPRCWVRVRTHQLQTRTPATTMKMTSSSAACLKVDHTAMSSGEGSLGCESTRLRSWLAGSVD